MENYQMISLIPARGGSKRIPRKNTKMLVGKPMIAWTIEASLQSKYISRTFVSTKDPEVKEISLKYGAEVIDRPPKYATELYGNGFEMLETLNHFKEVVWDMGVRPDYLAFLMATSPLRTAEQIDKAYELMLERNCTKVYTAYKMSASTERCMFLDERGRAEQVYEYTPREMYLKNLGLEFQEPKYIFCSDVVITRFLDAEPFGNINFNDLTLFIIDEKDMVDVDTEFDFEMAEMILKKRLKMI